MKTLHIYLLTQILKNLLLTVLVLTFLFLIGNALRDILKLVATHNVPLKTVLNAFAYLLPFVLVYTLPIAFLTSTLLVFGKLSSDLELTAIRASGISLTSFIHPVIALSILFCFLCAWVNLDLGPKGRVAFKNILFQAGQKDLKNLIPEGRFITDFPGYVFYVGKIQDDRLSNVLFYQITNAKKLVDIRSASAQLINDPSSETLILRFFKPTIFTRKSGGISSLYSNIPDSTSQTNNPIPSPDNFQSLSESPSADWRALYTGQLDFPIPRPNSSAFRKAKLSEMTLTQLLQELNSLKLSGLPDADLLPIKIQLHEKLSFSFASLGFTLVGIPLGIQSHRKDTSSGIAMALILMLVYYALLIAAKSLQSFTSLQPHLLIWLPNLIFQSLGTFLIHKKNSS